VFCLFGPKESYLLRFRDIIRILGPINIFKDIIPVRDANACVIRKRLQILVETA